MTGRDQPGEIELLRKRDQFLARILDSSLNGLYTFNLQRREITYTNSEYTRLTGYTLERLQALGANGFVQLFHEEDRARMIEHAARMSAAHDGEVHEVEYRFLRADGTWICCLSRETVLERDASGAVLQYVGTFLDITEKKAAAEAVRLAEEQRLAALQDLRRVHAVLESIVEGSQDLIAPSTLISATYSSIRLIIERLCACSARMSQSARACWTR